MYTSLCFVFFLFYKNSNVDFATGFHDLSQDDQLILIKTGFFEIWLTQHTRLFSGTDHTLQLGDGTLISSDELDMVFTVSVVQIMRILSNIKCGNITLSKV